MWRMTAFPLLVLIVVAAYLFEVVGWLCGLLHEWSSKAMVALSEWIWGV